MSRRSLKVQAMRGLGSWTAYRRRSHRRRSTRQSARRKSLFRKGYNRTGGFYGRYSNGGEKKFLDSVVDDAVIATGGLIFNSVNKIPQGTTESERVGRKCTITNIGWKMSINLPATTAAANTSDIVRVIMFIDKQANGATANVTDILESADFLSFNNLANTSRFRTLMDRTYALSSKAGGGDGTTEDYAEEEITDSFYKKCHIPIEFDSTAGAITEIRSNNVGILVISKAGVAGLNSKVRVRYSDA